MTAIYRRHTESWTLPEHVSGPGQCPNSTLKCPSPLDRQRHERGSTLLIWQSPINHKTRHRHHNQHLWRAKWPHRGRCYPANGITGLRTVCYSIRHIFMSWPSSWRLHFPPNPDEASLPIMPSRQGTDTIPSHTEEKEKPIYQAPIYIIR